MDSRSIAAKWHTATSAARDFVQRIWRKLGLLPPPGPLEEFLARLDQENSKAARLARLVLADMMRSHDQQHLLVDPKVGREWAFALGQVLGLLSALCVKDKTRIPDAIGEVASAATKTALEIIGKGNTKTHSRTSAAPTEDAQRLTMIAALQAQSQQQSDPATKAALDLMIQRLRSNGEVSQ